MNIEQQWNQSEIDIWSIVTGYWIPKNNGIHSDSIVGGKTAAGCCLLRNSEIGLDSKAWFEETDISGFGP
jgi:hypothetical protein